MAKVSIWKIKQTLASYLNPFTSTFSSCIQTHFSGLQQDFLTRQFTDIERIFFQTIPHESWPWTWWSRSYVP